MAKTVITALIRPSLAVKIKTLNAIENKDIQKDMEDFIFEARKASVDYLSSIGNKYKLKKNHVGLVNALRRTGFSSNQSAQYLRYSWPDINHIQSVAPYWKYIDQGNKWAKMIKPPLIWFSTEKVTGRGAGKAYTGSDYKKARGAGRSLTEFGFYKKSRRGNDLKIGNRAFADRSRHGKDLGTGIGIGASSIKAKWIPLTFTGYNYIAKGVEYANANRRKFAYMVKKSLIESFNKK